MRHARTLARGNGRRSCLACTDSNALEPWDARRVTHNPEVVGSNPTPATKTKTPDLHGQGSSSRPGWSRQGRVGPDGHGRGHGCDPERRRDGTHMRVQDSDDQGSTQPGDVPESAAMGAWHSDRVYRGPCGRYRSVVAWFEAAVWGLFGGLLVAGLDFVTVVGRIGDWPWKSRKRLRVGPYTAATLVRLVLSAGLTVAFARSGMELSPLAAVTVGIATPLIVEKLAQAGRELAPGGGDG
jgi:hypothetical protein